MTEPVSVTTLLLNAVAILLGVLALLYALKKLLPTAMVARLTGKSPVSSRSSACGPACGGCSQKRPVA